MSLENFDYVVSPEHDGLSGANVINSKGAIHYLTLNEINNEKNYLENKLDKDKDIIALILGGPTKYYDYNNENKFINCLFVLWFNLFSRIYNWEHSI